MGFFWTSGCVSVVVFRCSTAVVQMKQRRQSALVTMRENKMLTWNISSQVGPDWLFFRSL